MQSTRIEFGPEAASAWKLSALIAVAMAIAACADEAPAEIDAGPTASAFLPANAPSAVGCGPSGRMHGSLYGALNADLDWSVETMHCEGMPRPDGDGARLRFAGVAGDMPIAIIIAIPALERARPAAELPTKVTIIQEGNGRFFSTVDAEHCWTDVDGQVAIDDGSDQFIVDGRLYCISPLAEVNGGASVSITDLSFTGLLDWGTG